MDVATYDTTEPTVAVIATSGQSGDPRTDWPASDLDVDADVRDVADVDALRSLLAAETVDCVLVGAADDGAASHRLAEIVAAAREHDDDLPVVFAPPEPAPEVFTAVANEPATYYRPQHTGASTGDATEREADDALEGEADDPPEAEAGDGPPLAAVVDDAVATYDRRRQDARERAMFREVMEMAPLAIYVKDEAARHVAVSDGAELGTDEPMLEKTDRELFEPASSGYEDDLDILETGEPIEDAEEHVELAGGGDIWLRTTKVPRRNDDDEITGLLGVTRDVTPEKRREQELERETRRLEQFASFASHDLRNPVMVAQGNLDLAHQEELPESAAEHLETADDALDRMEQLIEDLLDIARPDEDREEEWTALASVVERAWTAVDEPGATLTVDVPEDFEVRAASGALRQLMENVLGNAVEHGGSPVAIEVGTTPTGFYVADDGPGIPPEEREQVFEYGYTTGGSGIGLAITDEIAEAHGWEASVTESAEGGARFTFERCLIRRAGAPAPTEGDPVALETWTTVGDLAVEGEAIERDAREGDGRDGADWTIRGGGRALWGGTEAYAIQAGEVDGGVRIEGVLTNVESVHDYAKAGLLLADAIEPGAPLCFVGKTAEHGTEGAWRTAADGPVVTDQAEPDATLPRWYRIDRLDDVVTVWVSEDGVGWTMLDRHVLPLTDPISVGLAVVSHDEGVLCEATFEAVRAVSLAPGSE